MISEIYSYNGTCIWMDPEFFQDENNAIPDASGTFVDVFGNKMATPKDFSKERSFITNAINGNRLSQVLYNESLAKALIAIFREDVMRNGIQGAGRTILNSMSEVFLCLLAGAFSEAADALNEIAENDFLTAERKIRYVNMINSADAINYDSNEVQNG